MLLLYFSIIIVDLILKKNNDYFYYYLMYKIVLNKYLKSKINYFFILTVLTFISLFHSIPFYA